MLRWVLLSATCLALGRVSLCQEMTCTQVAALAEMTKARSTEVLSRQKRVAGDSYRARMVYAFRLFELRPQDRDAASLLLSRIPKDEEQDSVRATLSTFLCESEPLSAVKALARVGDDLPRQFARAVLTVRSAMAAYIAYSQIAVLDPHNDHTLQMQRVCRQAHPEFVRAVDLLSQGDKEWFTGHIFDPGKCRPLSLPEAE